MGIKDASTSILVRDLIHEVKRKNGTPDNSTVRKLLICISSLILQGQDDKNFQHVLKDLSKTKFIPVSVKGQKLEWRSAEDDFVISDHERYGAALYPELTIVDFKLPEVQLLHPLIYQLGLSDRYLSERAYERSEISEKTEPDNNLSHALQQKAYALYW